MRWGALLLILTLESALSLGPGIAAEKTLSGKSLPPPPALAPAPDVKPYDPQLMRLAEILGALTYLRDLCGESDAGVFSARMQALLEAEGSTEGRKDRLAGAYNSGMEGYALSYRACTPNARAVIDRYLEQAVRLAKALENQYGAT